MEEFKTKYIYMHLSKESDCIKLEFLSYVCSSGWLSLFAILRVFEWTERSNRTHMGFLCITSYRLQVKIGFWHTRETFVYCFAWSIAYVLEYQKLKSFIYPNIYRNIIKKMGKNPLKTVNLTFIAQFLVFFPWNCRKIETHLPIWFWEKVKVFSGISGQDFFC